MVMVVVVSVSAVVILTLLLVVISERLCRQELIAQAILSGTQTIEAELHTLRSSLATGCRRSEAMVDPWWMTSRC